MYIIRAETREKYELRTLKKIKANKSNYFAVERTYKHGIPTEAEKNYSAHHKRTHFNMRPVLISKKHNYYSKGCRDIHSLFI